MVKPKSFEALLEEAIPEINFLTTASSDLQPGHLLESPKKDIITGYLPDFLESLNIMNGKSFDTTQESFDLHTRSINGLAINSSSLVIMNYLGLRFDSHLSYRIQFDIKELTSLKFSENLDKINFEIALNQLKHGEKEKRELFKRLKGYFLVLRVLYASKFEIQVEVKKDDTYEAITPSDTSVNSFSAEVKRSQNSLFVSGNETIPFGVIGYRIGSNRLKEID